MKLVFISDTHGLHRRMLHPIPAGDVLIHCGDMTGASARSVHNIMDTAAWMGEQPHRYKIAIAGNHDGGLESFETSPACRTAFRESGVIYLEDAAVTLAAFPEVKFYGAPWTPNFYNWHFMPPRNSLKLKTKWDLIPTDTQVLITHGPPHGILDETCTRYQQAGAQDHAGCELLRARIAELKQLKVHAFGHIHEGYGMTGQYYETPVRFVNAAICNRDYEPLNRPIEVEL